MYTDHVACCYLVEGEVDEQFEVKVVCILTM